MRLPDRADQIAWGVLGATAAGTFAIWMFFFPDSIAEKFAWDVHPRMAQAFIGAGYVFRTAFFLSVAFGRDWTRLRWMFWGNLAFTGTLLLATFWHAGEFNWDPAQTPVAHLWLILYIFEPVDDALHGPARRLAAPGADDRRPDLAAVPLVPDRGDRAAALGRPAARDQPRVRRTPLAVGAEPARRADRRGLVPRLGGLVRDDGVRPRLDEIRLPAALFILNGAALIARHLPERRSAERHGAGAAYRTGVLAADRADGRLRRVQEVAGSGACPLREGEA